MADQAEIEKRVIEALQTVYDPEIPVNIHELGLIYGIAVDPSGAVTVRMTLTAAGCPAAQALPREVEERVRAVPGVRAAIIGELTKRVLAGKPRGLERGVVALVDEQAPGGALGRQAGPAAPDTGWPSRSPPAQLNSATGARSCSTTRCALVLLRNIGLNAYPGPASLTASSASQDYGVVKMNIDTDMQYAFRSYGLRNF
jgi:metal-sulfur cluster biosynthetic enzyme